MKLKGFIALAALAVAAFAALVLSSGGASAQGAPAPMIFKGTVTVSGQPAPDSYEIFARITASGAGGQTYQTEPVLTEGGSYPFLTVAPPPPTRFGARSPFNGQRITFYLEGEQANESAIYMASGIPDVSQTLNLTFAALPTPVPTATPAPTAAPPATATPVAPVNTPTPTTAAPMTFSSGLIVAISGAVPADAELTARMEGYTSLPADITPDGGQYFGLIVDPKRPELIGQEIEFFLNGIKSRTTRKFESGAVVRDFDLLFELPAIPTPTPEPTPIPEPTPVPPTPTPEPTPVPEPPTPTPEPPTPTPEPAPAADTPTPVPTAPEPEPTATAEPEPTATPEPEPTNTPIAREAPPPPPEPSGGCGSATANLPFGTAAANLALLLAPLGLIGIRKLTIRNRRR